MLHAPSPSSVHRSSLVKLVVSTPTPAALHNNSSSPTTPMVARGSPCSSVTTANYWLEPPPLQIDCRSLTWIRSRIHALM